MSVAHLELFDQLGDYPTPFNRHDEEDEDCDEDEDDEDEIPKIRIGICAMSKKTNSPPMQEILRRMSVFDCADIFVFSEDTIMNVPVEEWPICDCLISFYSHGFPLEKAIEYAKLTNPFVLNDLEMQYALMHRPTMYSLLEIAGIDTPRHAILLRDEDGNPINTKFVELDDSVQIGDEVFQKPFVEKPVDAEDHNVYIYFPSGAGGGSQRLFRKVGDRSSVYSPESSVRKEGSYIYEDFVVTDGTDVKVYTVGPEYAHAEARKSPSLDGKVERDSQGKEIRYPIILDQHEKELAHKVCKLFKQTVCGCDLLRTHGKSYVCDVNGFSFVKTSKKYYDDAAQVLMSLIVQELAPQLYKPYNLDVQEEIPTVEALEGTMLELRCVVGIIRHGDRTPKQKMKMEVRHPRFIDLFRKYHGFDDHKLKLKKPTQLQEVLNIARDLLADIKEGKPVFEKPNKIHQLRTVLEMYGYFSGINRKIQFKYLGKPRDGTDSEHSDRNVEGKGEQEVKRKESGEEKSQTSKESKQTEEADQKGSEEKLEVPVDKEHSLLLIVKWGGELTMMGREQALELGRAFRCMYPGGQGQYSKLSDCGLLRLHSTYRHDLKIYASDEGRVQMTAAAFAKGFLALEGELAPVLVHLVRSDNNTTEMLDTPDDAAKILGKVKHRLHKMLHSNEDFKEADFAKLAPTRCHSVINAMKFVKNPYKMCEKIYNLMQALTGHLKELIAQKVYDPRDPFLYQDETLELMMHRWTKLEKDFKLRNGQFDISLIPDIYDCIKYDVQHNSQLNLINSLDLYKCAKAFADIVIPQEYGITRDEKLGVAHSVCARLLKKIKGDLRHADTSDIHTRLNPDYLQSVEAPHRHVRTRLYFTSESHVHTVVNALRHGKLFENIPDEQWQTAVEFLAQVPELNYMTQLVLMLYEDPKADPLSDHRFHVELHFSPGAKTMDDPKFLASTSPSRKASEEEMRSSAANFPSSDRDVEHASKISKVDENRMMDSGHQGEDASEDTSLSDLTPSSHFLVTTSTNPGQCEAEENSQDCMKAVKWTIGTSQSLESADEEAAESNVFEAYDDVVYSGNELPRCAIGSDDYSDSALGASLEDISVSPGMSIDELPREEKLLSGRRHSMSDTELKSFHGVTTEKPGQNIRKKGTQVRRRKSESDFVNNVATATGDVTQKGKGGRKISSVTCIVEEDASEPYVPVGRSKSHSMIENGNLDTNSQETSKPPATRTRRVSFELVRRQRQDELHGQQVKTIESSPYKKRFSPGSASTIRALRKLSFDIQSAWVVRPYSVTKSSKKSSKPRIAEFYEEMTKVESLNPLRTLHNAVPLKEMDKFFDKVTGQGIKVRVPPVPGPSRNTTRESNVTDLLTEAIKKLHS